MPMSSTMKRRRSAASMGVREMLPDGSRATFCPSGNAHDAVAPDQPCVERIIERTPASGLLVQPKERIPGGIQAVDAAVESAGHVQGAPADMPPAAFALCSGPRQAGVIDAGRSVIVQGQRLAVQHGCVDEIDLTAVTGLR